MKRYRSIKQLFLLLCCLHSIVATAQRFDYRHDYERMRLRTQDPADSLYYQTLLPRFQANDPGLTVFEVLALMVGYTGQENYRPYTEAKTEQLVTQLNDSARYKEAAGICDTFLRHHPLNQQVLLEKAYAFYQLKQPDSARYYKEQFARIMAAMDWSGTGISPDEAMFATGPKDGQNFIDKYYHADLGRAGTAEDSEGNLCTMLEIKFKKNGSEQTRVLYFVIQHAVNTTAPDYTAKPARPGNNSKK